MRPFSFIFLGLLLWACSPPADQESSAQSDPIPDGPGLAIPAAVRRNLGMTFARAEYRRVQAMRRVPGRFELAPEATLREHAPRAGRVSLLVDQYQHVDAGDALYHLDSPDWRALQRELSAAEANIAEAEVDLAEALSTQRSATAGQAAAKIALERHRRHALALGEAEELWRQRITQLQGLAADAGGFAAELAAARAALADAIAAASAAAEKATDMERELAVLTDQLAEEGILATRIAAARLRLTSRQAHHDLLLHEAASLSGLSEQALLAEENGERYWRGLTQLTRRSRQAGVVSVIAVSDGAWLAADESILSIIDPSALRFRAAGLQSDLAFLRDGAAAQIVPASQEHGLAGLPGLLHLGWEADAASRRIDVVVEARGEWHAAWVRPGVAAVAEYAVGEAEEELAIPIRALISDGKDRIFFRRLPQNPDRVMRVVLDGGTEDGRWVVVKSGLVEGDEVVMDGIYELKLAGSAQADKSGHFHPDGSWHDGEH